MKVLKIPTIDVNETECGIREIYFSNGDHIKTGDLIVSLETTKTVEDIEVEQSGFIYYLKNRDENIKFGQPFAHIFDTKAELEKFITHKANVNSHINNVRYTITEKARQFISDNDLNLDDFEEMFHNKKIIKKTDIEKALNKSTPILREIEIQNNRKRIVIIGGGRGAEVVADILLDYPEYEVVGFVDDNPRIGFKFYGIEVIYDNIMDFPLKYDNTTYDAVIISIAGNMKLRQKLMNHYEDLDIKFINAIDKSTKIGRNVKIGLGNVIGANCYIGTSSVIGNNNWIAASVNLDHHNRIGDNNLFGPNFSSPGIVEIGNRNKFGCNSSLSNYLKIGDDNVIMNNVAVYKNLQNGETKK